MKFTIIGAGIMGRGIGTCAIAGGHEVSQLVADGGMRPIDVGPLARAQQLEQLGFLHVSIQEPLGLGVGSTVKLHP